MSLYLLVPRCHANDWAEGPEGVGSINVLCRHCGTEFCYSLGLERMPRDESRAQLYGYKKLPKLEE